MKDLSFLTDRDFKIFYRLISGRRHNLGHNICIKRQTPDLSGRGISFFIRLDPERFTGCFGCNLKHGSFQRFFFACLPVCILTHLNNLQLSADDLLGNIDPDIRGNMFRRPVCRDLPDKCPGVDLISFRRLRLPDRHGPERQRRFSF